MSAAFAASAGVAAPLAAIGDEARHGFRRDVAADDLEPGAAQRGRHAEAHRAEPDDGDARFG